MRGTQKRIAYDRLLCSMGIFFIPIFIAQLIAVSRMHKNVIVKSVPIDKYKNNASLNIIIVPDFIRKTFRRAGIAFNVVIWTIGDIDAATICSPSLTVT